MKPRLALTFALIAAPGLAQNAPWTSVLRGSWVETGSAAAGDVMLASRDAG